jgi:cytochrome c553
MLAEAAEGMVIAMVVLQWLATLYVAAEVVLKVGLLAFAWVYGFCPIRQIALCCDASHADHHSEVTSDRPNASTVCPSCHNQPGDGLLVAFSSHSPSHSDAELH